MSKANMVRIVSMLPSTSDECNGVRFVRLSETLAVSEQLPADHPQAVRMQTIPGYRLASPEDPFDPVEVDAKISRRRAEPIEREKDATRTANELVRANQAQSEELRQAKVRIFDLEQSAGQLDPLREQVKTLGEQVAGLEAEKAGLLADKQRLETEHAAALQDKQRLEAENAELAEKLAAAVVPPPAPTGEGAGADKGDGGKDGKAKK